MTPKFRAWHKLHGEMRKVYGITFSSKQKITRLFIKGFQPGERSKFTWYQVMDETDKYDISMKFEELFILMQYTGLKDKNGIEIYEGDIVKASSTGIWGKFQVKWRQDGSPCWIMYPAWKSGITWSLHGTLNDKSEYQDDVEVIGNIYENPELLED